MEETIAGLSDDEMLAKLTARAGRWHELAPMLRALNAKGFDGMIIEEMTGLDRVTQSNWIIANEVYRSLADSGATPLERVSHFPQQRCTISVNPLRLSHDIQSAAIIRSFIPKSHRPSMQGSSLPRSWLTLTPPHALTACWRCATTT